MDDAMHMHAPASSTNSSPPAVSTCTTGRHVYCTSRCLGQCDALYSASSSAYVGGEGRVSVPCVRAEAGLPRLCERKTERAQRFLSWVGEGMGWGALLWTMMVVMAHLMRRGPHGRHRLHGRPHLPHVRLVVPLPSASPRRSERKPSVPPSRALTGIRCGAGKHEGVEPAAGCRVGDGDTRTHCAKTHSRRARGGAPT